MIVETKVNFTAEPVTMYESIHGLSRLQSDLKAFSFLPNFPYYLVVYEHDYRINLNFN